jgi:formamidopyrimidine-DNA glycosylase
VPELPEIRAHAERLTAEFGGRPLARFRALSFTALKTFSPSPDDAGGHELRAVGQRGKHLLLDFDVVTFVVHLMQGGRLKPDDKQAAKPRNGQARWVFAEGPALLLTEAGTERKAGVWVVEGDPEGQPPIEGIGPDADTVDEATLATLLADHPMRLHGFLRDQHHVAGLGRLLANEVCHRARLSPFAGTAKLSAEEVGRLHAAIGACIDEGLAYERGLTEMSMSADRPAHVHHRAGQPCPVCGDEVRAVEYSAYTVSYCPTCQTGGKILADNTTSKFLK